MMILNKNTHTNINCPLYLPNSPLNLFRRIFLEQERRKSERKKIKRFNKKALIFVNIIVLVEYFPVIQ